MDDFTDPLLAALGRERPSGYQQAMGYRLAAWREGEAVLVMEIGPQHLNRARVVHGGVLASLIDTACGFAGTFAPVPGEQPKVSTLTLTTSFVAPARERPPARHGPGAGRRPLGVLRGGRDPRRGRRARRLRRGLVPLPSRRPARIRRAPR
jgi:uncharacterized protein (TIGR00369 family)